MSLLSAPYFHDEAAAHTLVEEIVWPTGPVCPRCEGTDRITRVNGARIGLYRCGPCERQFTVKVGTVFESSHIPLNQWVQAVYMMASSKKGISSHQVMRTLEVQYKTAWFMTHRIREAMRPAKFAQLGGAGQTVEADEVYIGRKPGTKVRRGTGHKNPVLSLVQRDGAVRSFHVPNVSAATLRPIVARHVHADTRFQTDELRTNIQVGETFAYHGVVNHSAEEYVRGDDYTNAIEGYFSIVKRGIYGIY